MKDVGRQLAFCEWEVVSILSGQDILRFWRVHFGVRFFIPCVYNRYKICNDVKHATRLKKSPFYSSGSFHFYGYLALPVFLLTFLSCVSPSSYTVTVTGVAACIFSLTSSSSLSKSNGLTVWVSVDVGNHNNVVPASFMNC